MYFRHPHLLPLLRQWWVSTPLVDGTRVFQSHKKLKYDKNQIKVRNIKVCKNIFVQKEVVMKEMEDIDDYIIRHGLDALAFTRKKEKQEDWSELSCREEEY